METCAKTGSTDDYVDRWLCGMTPYYTAACWFGYDNNQEPMYVKGKGLVSVDGKNPAGALWSAIMKNIHNINKDKVNIKYSQFNRNIGDEYTLSYYIEDNILYVNIGPQVLRIQILALFNIDEFKRNLRTNKELKDHISYIEEIYKEILIETIKSKCSKTFNDMKIKIMQNNVNIDIRQAIGYLLYLFQAIKWIALEQIDEDDILRKISISTEFTNICTKYKMFIEKKEKSSFGKEFKFE